MRPLRWHRSSATLFFLAIRARLLGSVDLGPANLGRLPLNLPLQVQHLVFKAQL
jgi:hypothetical protein